MKDEHRLLVKANIESLANDINTLSQIFYRELFHLDIKLKSIFSGNVVFLNRKFTNMLGTFKNVTHLEKISASVGKMGERHLIHYGAQVEHFGIMQKALMIALKEYFGDSFTDELEKAWQQIFQEVTDIMQQAMKVIDRRLIKRPDMDRKYLDTQAYDADLLSDVNGEEGMLKIHQRFYDVMFDEPWLGQFFYGKSKESLIIKQTQFMVAAFGGKNNYTGDTPAFVHMHMYVTDEMSDFRQKILKQAILDEGYSDSVAERWLKVDDSFRESIVKKSVSECVMKCRGQMPIKVEKPMHYDKDFSKKTKMEVY